MGKVTKKIKITLLQFSYELSHWNATLIIIIMNGWMISFEWKTSKHYENKEHVATLWLYFDKFPSMTIFFSMDKYFENIVKIVLSKNYNDVIHNEIAV